MQEMKRQKDDSYVKIMKYDMSENKVRDILNTAEYSGIAPSILLTHPELLPEAEKLAGERRSFLGYFVGAFQNMLANYWQSTSQKDALESYEATREANNIINYSEQDLKEEGMRAWLDSGVAGDLYGQMPSDNEFIAMGRKSLESGANITARSKSESSKFWGDLSKKMSVHMRPPDSVIGATMISAIENSGFTIMSSLRSLVGWTLGGWGGGIISAGMNTYDESQREAGEAFVEALRRGRTPEDAYNLSKEVYRNNMILLPISN